jgi:hypothetical protein
MALVNPQIAMSYRPTTEYQPRNALAEYAQVQQIVGGQRQAEMADMQMEDLRRERGVLGQIAAAISAKGGPDLKSASLLMMQNPRTSEQGYNIYQALQKQQRLEDYERRYGGGAAATTPTSAAGAITGAAPAIEPAAEPAKPTPYTVGPQGVMTYPQGYFKPLDENTIAAQRAADQAEQSRERSASTPAEVMQRAASFAQTRGEMYPTDADIAAARRELNIPAPANALAPAPVAPAPTNAMLAAQPATPPAGINQLAAAGAVPNVDALRRQYNLAVKAGSPDATVLLKQIEAALKPAAAKPDTVPSSVRELQAYLQMSPEERAAFEKLQKIRTTNVTATATAAGSPTGKSLAAPVGQRAEASLVKAEGAAGIMENANMVREALNTGNVIAGPLAGVRTKFAQVLEVAGAGDKEKLVNTRNTIQGLASLTLESRAELKGQGQITDTETKLLERARSADIGELTIPELQQVVNISQRLANRMWSNHQSLLRTMRTDPAAADSIRYYEPTMSLPQAIGEGKPQAEVDKRTQGLDKIFKQPGR